jgi:branched-chain amino acid transport system ATP-binding protein
MMTSAPILQAKNLTKYFGGLRAVAQVSFAIEPFGVTSIIGPNGAGKTTLFNLLSGLYIPEGGQLLLGGKDITELSPVDRLANGMARSFQITNLFFDLTVEQNLQLAAQKLETWPKLFYAANKSQLAMTRAQELIEEFQLQEKKDEPVAYLSHGEQRRLEIAVTMALKPKILLLDEPTQGMSQGDTHKTSELIAQLAKNVTVLLIEHDVELVMDLSKHVIVMAQGEKIAEGNPHNVRSNPIVQAAYFGDVV